MTLTPQPASKYNEIIEEINFFMKTWNFTEFQIKKLKKEAENIKNNADLAAGFSLLGMIAYLENDFESTHSYFKRAVEQSCGETEYLYAYALFLLKISNFREAYKYALKAYEKSPEQKYLDVLIKAVAALNKRDEFRKYTNEWRELIGKDHRNLMVPLHMSEFPTSIQTIRALLEFIRNYPEVKEIQELCGPALIRFFGAPLSVRDERMQDSSHEDKLVLWIQWFGDMDDGLARYDQFEDWYIENDYDLKTDRINFNIEFVEE